MCLVAKDSDTEEACNCTVKAGIVSEQAIMI